MRKSWFAAFWTLLLLNAACAFAEVSLEYNPLVSEKKMLEALRGTKYEGYILYQPTDADQSVSMMDAVAFDHFPYFPIVAVKNNEAVLLLLKKEESSWKLAIENKTALNRDDFTLYGFQLNSNIHPSAGMFIHFTFYEKKDRQTNYQLILKAYEDFSPQFASLGMNVEIPDWNQLYAQNINIIFNGGYIYQYSYTDSGHTATYDINTITSESEGVVSDFDLNKVPLSIFDAMKSCTTRSATINNGDICMMQFPNIGSAVLCTIEDGTKILREVRDVGFGSQTWVLVAYENKLGYVHVSNILFE